MTPSHTPISATQRTPRPPREDKRTASATSQGVDTRHNNTTRTTPSAASEWRWVSPNRKTHSAPPNALAGTSQQSCGGSSGLAAGARLLGHHDLDELLVVDLAVAVNV